MFKKLLKITCFATTGLSAAAMDGKGVGLPEKNLENLTVLGNVGGKNPSEQLRDHDYYRQELQKLEELTRRIHEEVDRILKEFRKNMEAYYRLTRGVGTKEKEEVAVQTFQKHIKNYNLQVAKKQNFQEMYAQGLQYRDGRVGGYPKSSFMAQAYAGAYFLPFAYEGDFKAQHNLGMSFYQQGNYVSACRWLKKAADQNFQPSIKNLGILTKEMSLKTLLMLPSDVFISICEYLDNNSLLAFRTTTFKAAQMADNAFYKRAEIKMPLACLNAADKAHPFPHTMSYFLRELLYQIPGYLLLRDKPKKTKEDQIFLKCEEFCKGWGYPGATLFHYLGAEYPKKDKYNPPSKYIDFLVKFYKNILKENSVIDNLELAICILIHLSVTNNYFEYNSCKEIAEKMVLLKRSDLALYYLNFSVCLLIRSREYDAAKRLNELIIDQKNPISQLMFAFILQNGSDFEKENIYFQKVADQGNSNVYFNFEVTLYKMGCILEKRNISQAKICWEIAANQRNAKALCSLAKIYKEEWKLKEAEQYYRMAANQGSAKAQFELAQLLQRERNFEQAKQYYRMAANQGSAKAQFELAQLLQRERNFFEQAKQYYRMAANQGNAKAQFELVQLLQREGDFEQAKQYCRMAIAQGNAEARSELRNILNNERNFKLEKNRQKIIMSHPDCLRWYQVAVGSEEDRNINKAKKYYYMAAVQGLDLAQYNLGIIFKQERNFEQAKICLGMAAKQGHDDAQNFLGIIFEREGNIPLAKKYYQMAAKQGYYRAQYNLGLLLERECNKSLAEKYYQMAAEQGDDVAQNKLGVKLYNEGFINEGKTYIEMAAVQGNSDAKNNLEIIRQQG